MAYIFQLQHVPFALEAVIRWREFMAERNGEDDPRFQERARLPRRLRGACGSFPFRISFSLSRRSSVFSYPSKAYLIN